MDSARTSKEMNFRSGSDREKLSDQAKSDFDIIAERAEEGKREEKENFRRFFEQRVTKAEDDMLRTPKPSLDGPKMTLTIDGKPVQPPTVWKREDLTPQAARDLRKSAEQKVVRDHEGQLDQIEQTGEDKQRALLDRELGPRRYDRDRSYGDVGDSNGKLPPHMAATRGDVDLGDKPEASTHLQGSSLDAEIVDDAYIKKVEAYQAEHEKGSEGPSAGNADDELKLSGSENLAPQLGEEPAFEWTPELTASFNEIKDQHEAEQSRDHDIGPEYT